MTVNRVRVAVIGTGWWATSTHIPALREDPRAELVALCDVSAERVAAAAAASGVERTYIDYQKMLEAERPDAIVVATTHATHFDVTRACLEAGAHVLLEKPMTLLASDAQALTELAERCGRALIVGYPWNYMPYVQKVRDIITSGQIGPVQFLHCVFNSYNADLIGGKDRSDRPDAYTVHGPGDVYSKKEHSGGGHGHLQITHAAGLLFFVTGIRIQSVRALMANHGLPLDLVDVMMVEFEGGGLGIVGGSSNGFLPKLDLHVGCAHGAVEMDMFGGTAVVKFADGRREEWGTNERTYIPTMPVLNLIGVASGEETPLSTAEVGWRAVELLDAAYRSAEEGGRAVLREELYSVADGGAQRDDQGGRNQ